MGQLVHSLPSEEIKIIVSVVVLIVHFVLVRFRLYEKLLFFLARYSKIVNAFVLFLIEEVEKIKDEKTKKILKEVGLQAYLLVEQYAKKTGIKGNEKFEHFLEILKEYGVNVERDKWEIHKFVEVVNFIQKNTKDDFLDKAKEVINEMFKIALPTKILRNFVKIVMGVFGILK
jgi:CRISPR/Cas system CSM-associated protein Csm2 small subunit